METTYREWEKRRQEGGRRTSRRKSGPALGPREARRLGQLCVCLVLFLAVFIGKGVFPERLERVGGELALLIRSDTDFRGAFAGLGKSLSEGEPVWKGLNGLWTEVFGGGTRTVLVEAPQSELYQAQLAFLWGETSPAVHWLGEEAASPPAEPVEVIRPQPVPRPEAEPAVISMPYDGPPLPETATKDKYSLSAVGVTETVTPVLGWITSPFGWREHPVDGGEKFHNGVDLGVNLGTDVLAFAAGTVEFIGNSPIYGLYVQLRHAGGLSTFYAHCSQLLVSKGQTVQAGERIALSGESGNATGPHLHFEMKLNGLLLDPAYYIETT